MHRRPAFGALRPPLRSLAFAAPGGGARLEAEAERTLGNVKSTEDAHQTEADEQAGS